MTSSELNSLHGQSVLVKSSRDQRHPAIAMRGTLEVDPDVGPGGTALVKLVIDFPDMVSTPAHQRTLALTESDLARLTPAERGGFEFVTEQSFN